MKLSSITIKNYRALEDITIKLNKNMNIIYGENGVGKSSIIYILHDFFNSILQSNKQNNKQTFPIFYDGRIRDKNRESSILLNGNNGESVGICLLPNEQKEKMEPEYDKNLSIKSVSFIPGIVFQNIVQKVENGQIRFEVSMSPKFVYTRGIINYAKFKDDFFNLEVEENKKRVKEYEEKEKMEYNHPALQKIRESIKKINPAFGKITIEGEKENKNLIVEKNGIPLTVEDQLSSGEASAITMIGEICIDAFSESSTNDVIVLIDEVDTSLHPQWQMKIGKILKESFPDVQFIMTSHSPFIWAGLNKDEIIWLDHDNNGKIIQREVEYAKGGSVESIIAQFFDTARYDEEVSKRIHEIDDIIRNRDKDAAIKAIDSLKEQYGNIPIISQFNFKMRMMGL